MGDFLKFFSEAMAKRIPSSKRFKPTIEWATKRYDKFNKKFFDGELGDCGFEIFTTGMGASGNTYAMIHYDKSAKDNLFLDRENNRYFVKKQNGEPLYLTRKNFYKCYKPVIKLNGNYSGTEEAWDNTLIHEMCHLYTLQNGTQPVQYHGKEFKEIANKIAEKSNGKFKIERTASEEESKEYDLDPRVKEKNLVQQAKKLSKMMAVFCFKNDGNVELTTTSDEKLVDAVIKKNSKNPYVKIVVSNDKWLMDDLLKYGLLKDMKKYNPFILPRNLKMIAMDYPNKIVYKNW